ncbi:helix-turn-helix domain-containing protein [Reyranella sp.]|uniref:helix-turn-helix domain-containing protein n=1 Tax=Reyranella sp. TaxID=1929291 RepID=UPI003D13A5A9
MRDQREARALSIEDVAKRLRIRRPYLEAIEQGRFDQLPGAAYIPAFLRAYAAHLDLDPEKVLTAYQASGPVPIARPVALPADFPMLEKRAPIGLAVLTVLLVVGAGYAVWHYLPRQESIVAQKVPPVPDRLLASRPSPEPAPAPAVQQAIAPAPERNPMPTTVWPAPKQETAAAPVPPPAVAVPAPPPLVVMSVPSVGQAQAAQPPANERAAGPDSQEAVARGTTEQSNVATIATLPVKSDTQITARTNSWIELRSPGGDVLAQSYVRAGESYTVPAGISYRLTEAH